MKIFLMFVLLILSVYSCSNDSNNLTSFPFQPITIYQSTGYLDTITVFTSVNDSIYLENFDFNGYDSMIIRMRFDIISNGGAMPYIDYQLVKDGFSFPIIQESLPVGYYVLDGKYKSLPSGNYYFLDRSLNQDTGSYKVYINSLTILKY